MVTPQRRKDNQEATVILEYNSNLKFYKHAYVQLQCTSSIQILSFRYPSQAKFRKIKGSISYLQQDNIKVKAAQHVLQQFFYPSIYLLYAFLHLPGDLAVVIKHNKRNWW